MLGIGGGLLDFVWLKMWYVLRYREYAGLPVKIGSGPLNRL
jgi:hypothetical protein